MTNSTLKITQWAIAEKHTVYPCSSTALILKDPQEVVQSLPGPQNPAGRLYHFQPLCRNSIKAQKKEEKEKEKIT